MNVMITGASGGLGRAFAGECARRGYSLYLTDINEKGLCALACGLERRFDARVHTRACDITDADSVDEMMRALDDKGVKFDMLLNVAGVDFEGGFLKRDREKIAKIVSVNDEATLRITHAVLERRRQDGRFIAVFVSSLASMFPMPLKATYAASKRFLFDFALALRHELKLQGVNALALCPGGLVTSEGAIKGIEAQGFWGGATTNRLETVARRTLDKAIKGRAAYVPGALNRTLCAVGRVAPRSLVASVVHWRWRLAQKKWMDSEGAAADCLNVAHKNPS